MSLHITDFSKEVTQITDFIQKTLLAAQKKQVVIAVSGGIDSALSLALLSKTIPVTHIYPVFLPFAEQDMDDAQAITRHVSIPEKNWQTINIAPIVQSVAQIQAIRESESVRLGNVMARSRMIIVYDLAKKLDALVCGTENKSEKYLGYFTRFGDEASDFEPIVHLYKTQVREMVEHLELPAIFLEKSPSAGLWENQTDEQELGFSYQVADQVIDAVIVGGQTPETFAQQSGIDQELINKVVDRVQAVHFKHEVPYTL